MPAYSYKCDNCKNILNIIMSLEDYKSKKTNAVCECGKRSMKRVFGTFASKIEVGSDELLDLIKSDVRKITKKVKLGDINTIENIYGK
jgi:putative FmdB family regulatory protein